MRKILLLCLLSVAFLGCGRKTIIGVSFPEAPIELASNADFGMELINYYNILQLPDGTYRMYFSGNPLDGVAENERNQNLYLAESADGFHYELKCKVMDTVIEQSVFMVKDKEYPYRMVGCQWIGEKSWERGVFLWKSKDGIEVTDRKMLYDQIHDPECDGHPWQPLETLFQDNPGALQEPSYDRNGVQQEGRAAERYRDSGGGFPLQFCGLQGRQAI